MDKLLIVKLGGKILEQQELLDQFIDFYAAYPHPKILIHGGGKQATAYAEKLGVETKMVEGRRITDKPMLDVALMTYAGLLNKSLVAQINARGEKAIGVTGADGNLIVSDKRPPGAVDYGFVGDIRSVQAETFKTLLDAGLPPVVCALTHDQKGQMLNTNADAVANAIAQGLQANYTVELWLCMDLPGVLENIEEPESLLAEISPKRYTELKSAGKIHQGMIPKLDTAFASLDAGVDTVYISNVEALLNPNHSKTRIVQA